MYVYFIRHQYCDSRQMLTDVDPDEGDKNDPDGWGCWRSRDDSYPYDDDDDFGDDEDDSDPYYGEIPFLIAGEEDFRRWPEKCRHHGRRFGRLLRQIWSHQRSHCYGKRRRISRFRLCHFRRLRSRRQAHA